MRLIDVTDLEKFIQENVCAIGDDHLLLVAGDDGRWHEALPLVKTAYSVDKVVEELKTDSSVKLYGSQNSDNYMIPVNRVIKIVKQGGVSDDVCEWRIVDRPHNLPIYNTSCGKTRLQCATGVDIYCNGCGKKIKVVE